VVIIAFQDMRVMQQKEYSI